MAARIFSPWLGVLQLCGLLLAHCPGVALSSRTAAHSRRSRFEKQEEQKEEDAPSQQVARASGKQCLQEAVCAGNGNFGRLGNHLYILGTLFNFAIQHNLCFVATRGLADDMLGKVLQLPELIDVSADQTAKLAMQGRPASSIRCAHVCQHVGDCRRWRRGHKFIVRQEMQDLLRRGEGRLQCKANLSDPALGPRGIVMHLRSGDIMTETARSGRYPQPPCAFYTNLAERGNNGSAFDHVLVVTQRDMRNPCVEEMRKLSPRVRVQSTSMAADACTLVEAQNLAISVGTWGPALSTLSSRLRNLHVPFGTDANTTYTGKFDGQDQDWYLETVAEEGFLGVAQHVHSFPDYSTRWTSWEDRVKKMTKYPAVKIVTRTIPAL